MFSDRSLRWHNDIILNWVGGRCNVVRFIISEWWPTRTPTDPIIIVSYCYNIYAGEEKNYVFLELESCKCKPMHISSMQIMRLKQNEIIKSTRGCIFSSHCTEYISNISLVQAQAVLWCLVEWTQPFVVWDSLTMKSCFPWNSETDEKDRTQNK